MVRTEGRRGAGGGGGGFRGTPPGPREPPCRGEGILKEDECVLGCLVSLIASGVARMATGHPWERGGAPLGANGSAVRSFGGTGEGLHAGWKGSTGDGRRQSLDSRSLTVTSSPQLITGGGD